MAKSKLLAFFSGNFPAKYLPAYITPVFVEFVMFLVVALLLFPDYTFFAYSISAMGSPVKNPRGWLFFSASIWSMAILLMPFFMHAARTFMPYRPRSARIFQVAIIVMEIGTLLIGFFPEVPPIDSVHYIVAAMAFGGFYMAAIVSCICLFMMQRKTFMPRRKTTIRACVFLTILILSTISIGTLISALVSLHAEGIPANILINMYFWEWMYLAGMSTYIVLLAIVVSGEPAT
jgi:hypothetical protein